MKKLIVVLAFAASGTVAHGAVLVDAGGIIVGYTQEQCQSGPCHGYGYGGQIVGTGPRGYQGLPGEQGVAGEKGDKGDKGDPGQAAPARAPVVIEAQPTEGAITYNVGADVRWADYRHFSFNSGYRYDMKNKGHTIDAAVVQIKIGSSYEQRRLDRLERDLRVLQRQNTATVEGFDNLPNEAH